MIHTIGIARLKSPSSQQKVEPIENGRVDLHFNVENCVIWNRMESRTNSQFTLKFECVANEGGTDLS